MNEKGDFTQQPGYNPYPTQPPPQAYPIPQSSQANEQSFPAQPPPYTPGEQQHGKTLVGAQPCVAPPQVQCPPGYAMPPPGYMAPPPAGYMPHPGAPTYASGVPVTIVHQLSLGSSPVTCTCPKCNQTTCTNTESYAGSIIWLICLFIVLFGGWVFCLCFIPFCLEDLKDVRHSCPNCKHVIGVYKRNF